MSEKPPKITTESKPTVDPFEGWSDAERMSEYAETGDSMYLTPELAQEMRVGLDYEDTLEDDYETEIFLQEYGIDDSTLEGLDSLEDVFRVLLKVASLPIMEGDNVEIEETRFVIDVAIEKIKNYALSHENSIYQLFISMRHYEANGVRDVEAMHEVYRRIYRNFVTLSHTPDITEAQKLEGNNCAQSLNEFVFIAKEILAANEMNDDANYLTAMYLKDFAEKVGISEDAHLDTDDFLPFEIERGRLAVFSSDKTRVYVASKEHSAEVFPRISALSSKVSYKESGQYFARHLQVDIPEGLHNEINNLIDAGNALDVVKIFGIENSAILRDYISLLRSDTRTVIESEFNIRLNVLTIREQLHFLQYLQNVDATNANVLKSFTALYGVDGMRTFLSLERGDDSLGDSIVAFGQYPEVAHKVFTYYGELLDSADRAEALVREVSDCTGDLCIELATQVRENILNRAQKDLERAVRATDVRTIESQIETYVSEAKEYVALLQEIGLGNIEKLSSSELNTNDQDQMRTLQKANYEAMYPSIADADFKGAVFNSLEQSFKNTDTTFQVLRDDGKIVSYNRFDLMRDKVGKEISYFGSFNADPAYSGVGGVMLEETIKQKLKDGRPMMAHCDPLQPITKKYIEDGFVATDFIDFHGHADFEIWRSKDSSTYFESKNKSIEELLDPTFDSESIVVREKSTSESYPELQQGKVLTRYFTHQEKTYLIFETLPVTLQAQFTIQKEE